MLVTAKFHLHPELPNTKPNGFFSCTDCIYHKNGYILISNNCNYFYLWKIINFKQRIHKRKSDVKHPQNSNCRECAEHLRDCAKIELFFSDLSVLLWKRSLP